MKKIDNYLQILVKKHAEERQRKIRRRNELKHGPLDIKMDEELGRKRAFSEINEDGEDLDKNLNDLSDFGVDFSEFDGSKDLESDDYPGNTLLKTEPFKRDST